MGFNALATLLITLPVWFCGGCSITPTDPAMFGGPGSAEGGPGGPGDGGETGADSGAREETDTVTSSAGSGGEPTTDGSGPVGDPDTDPSSSEGTAAADGPTGAGEGTTEDSADSGESTGDPTTAGGSATAGPGACGNGVVEPGELCDGDDFDGETCETIGFQSGELMCDSDCVWDWSGCTF